MRVLHLISSGGMYGAEAVILNLSQQMNTGGLGWSTVGVFAHAGRDTPLFDAAKQIDVPCELLPCQGQIDLSVPGKIRKLIASLGVDVVHAHGYKADIYAALALKGHRRPLALVSTCHTWYDNDRAVRIYGALDRFVLRSFDQVVAVSAEVRERLLRAGLASGNVRVVRNGISTDRFKGQQRWEREPEAEGAYRVGLVGRLAPEKGVDIFVRAVAQLAAQFPRADFIVAGEGPDRVVLEALIDELNLRGRVTLSGAQADMPAFYASLDLLVSASRQEGLPMALLEGVASGLPVVATATGAVPEVVAQEQTGLLVAPEDPSALASAIRRLLTDATLRRRFGEVGRQRVLEHFSARRMAADYLEVYAEALAGRSRKEPLVQKSGAQA